jgi:hypothetical protein
MEGDAHRHARSALAHAHCRIYARAAGCISTLCAVIGNVLVGVLWQLLKRSSLALAGLGPGRLKKRFRPDTVYVTALVFHSGDMRILLTANGLLPALTVAHGHREVRTPTRCPRATMSPDCTYVCFLYGCSCVHVHFAVLVGLFSLTVSACLGVPWGRGEGRAAVDAQP